MRPSLPARLLLSTAVLALAAGGALAQTAPAAKPATAKPATVPTQLDAVSVSADRISRPVGESTSTVNVITSKELETRNVNRLQDLPRYEPGVTVSNSSTRSGAGGFAIRGIRDNRILMQIDGTRMPETPASAAPSAGYTRDMVDFDSLKQVEILRGPASALYGSDAIGGVVTYVTKDPNDYLTTPGKDIYASLKGGYDSTDSSFSQTGTFAARSGDFSILGVLTNRNGNEFRSKGTNFRNPQDYNGQNALGKLVWDKDDDKVTVTGEFFTRDTDTNLRSEQSATWRSATSSDQTRRWRVGVEHSHDAPVSFIDHFDWRVYATGMSRDEDRVRTSSTLAPGATVRENTANTSDQLIVGAALNLRSDLATGDVNHRISYGGSIDYTQTERLRNLWRTNLNTGVVTTTISGESYPNRTFPNTETLQAAAYVQDELTWGRLGVTPALRLDYYSMDPKIDAEYLRARTSQQPKQINELALSPKLGATYAVTDQFSLFGQYAHGFRAPPYDDAHLGFSNPVQGYEVLPNNNLQPETSNGFEAGLRGKFADGSSFQVGGFYNFYRNFLSQERVGTSSTGLMQFQSRNLSRVEIYGAEAKGDWRFLPAWSLFGAGAYALGFDKQTHRSLDSVAPLTLNAGLSYTDPSDMWGAQIAATHAFKKSEVSNSSYFQTPGYTTVDLAAYYNPVDWLSLSASVSNLFNESYYNYIDVIGLASNSNVRDRYLQAGRTIAISATVKW